MIVLERILLIERKCIQLDSIHSISLETTKASDSDNSISVVTQSVLALYTLFMLQIEYN